MAHKWNISEDTGIEKGLTLSSFDDVDFCEESSNMSPKPRPRNDITAAIPSTPEDWTWDKEHLTRMTNLLHSGFLSDITIIVGSDGKKIKAHKLFLQAGSPEFHRQLQKMNTDSDEDCFLTIENVEYGAFVMFLKFLYTGEIGFEAGTTIFLPLLKIATDYRVPTLINICVNKAKRCLSEANVLPIFEKAMECSNKELSNFALEFICKNAWKIVETVAFTELRQECLFAVLQRDDLRVRSEIHLFEAVQSWAEAECVRVGCPKDADSMRSVLEKVIGLIRFPVMDQAEFTMKVALKNILVMEELVKILLYFTVPIEERSKIPPGRFISKPREYYQENGNFEIPSSSAALGIFKTGGTTEFDSLELKDESISLSESDKVVEEIVEVQPKNNITEKSRPRQKEKKYLFKFKETSPLP